MPSPREVIDPLEDDVFEFVRKSEEAVVEVGRKWVHAVGEFMPVEMPLVRDMTKQLLDFLDELLRIQREFAKQMVDETRKAVIGTTKPAPKPHRAPAAKTTTHKAA